MNKKRLLVIGGGAAGFFCAVNAARKYPELEVMIVEKTDKVLSKVRISGGGRCNVTHACFSMAEMLKHYPRGGALLKKAFHRFFTKDTIEWFEKRGVPLKTEADGRMFPVSDDSASIVNCLVQEANKYKVEILFRHDVREIVYHKAAVDTPASFSIYFNNGKKLASDFICIAAGGYPKMGQYQWIEKTGTGIVAPVPSLFTFNIPGDTIRELMGVSVEQVLVKLGESKLSSTGPLLITHWGLSGPAILKLSAQAARELAARNYQFRITVNWLPAFNENSLREHFQQLRFERASQKLINRNPFNLPSRLWEYFIATAGINPDLRWADLPAPQQNKLIKILCTQDFSVSGKTGFKEEFVTAGGVAVAEINAQTMESRKIPGLFFAGEILDVDGVTGGFNFQNAWTTGWVAATGVGERLREAANDDAG